MSHRLHATLLHSTSRLIFPITTTKSATVELNYLGLVETSPKGMQIRAEIAIQKAVINLIVES